MFYFRFVKKFFLCLALLFCVYTGCNAGSKCSVELVPVDTLEKYVKYYFDKTSGQSYFIEEHKTGGYKIDSLSFYNQDLTQKLFSINIGFETATKRYNIISLDSIIAISGSGSATFCLIHFGRDGIVNSWTLLNVFKEQSCRIFPNPDPPVIIGKDLYYLLTPFFCPSYATFKDPIHYDKIEEFFGTQKSMAKIQFDGNDSIVNPQRFINFPKSYFQDSSICPGFNFNSFTSNSNNEIIFSFGEFDSVIVFKDGKEKKYLAKSKYISVPHLRKFAGENIDDKYKGTYPNIIYDSHRDLYYRIVKHPSTAPEDDVLLQEFEKPWSFVILNNKFEQVDEIYFSGEERLDKKFSVLPQGLLFTKHIDNGLFEEPTELYILHKIIIK